MLAEPKKLNSYRHANEIIELVQAFENCTLPIAGWNHEQYVTVAFWYLYLNPAPEANRLLLNSLRRFHFENNLQLFAEDSEGSKRTRLLRAMDNYIKVYKSEKTFVELGNLILEQFGDETYCAEIEDLKIDFPQIEVRRVVNLRQAARTGN
jgi:hypothetical protein